MSFLEADQAYTWLCSGPNSSDPFPVPNTQHVKNKLAFIKRNFRFCFSHFKRSFSTDIYFKKLSQMH